MLLNSDMDGTESLEDVAIRERQLEAYLLRSPEYLHRADQELKRQVSILYLAIAMVLLFQGFVIWRASSSLPLSVSLLTAIISVLAIVNCILLIRTKSFLRRLNEEWLKPEERSAVAALRNQRSEILARRSQGFSTTSSQE